VYQKGADLPSAFPLDKVSVLVVIFSHKKKCDDWEEKQDVSFQRAAVWCKAVASAG
jgi:hypothetical protein